LYKRACSPQLDTIYENLIERESKGSTAFGDGIAIPHARIKEIDKFVVSIAVSRKGIDFESLDKKKTKIFFTIIGPGKEQERYLKILAQISRVAKNRYARNEILNARSRIALKEAFLRYITPAEEDKGPKGIEDKKVLLIIPYLNPGEQETFFPMYRYSVNLLILQENVPI
jgi:PTS system nitrogen regulatory IIA component